VTSITELPAFDDPRIPERCLERVGPVTLVGVVHDHPASCHRVRTLVDTVAPAVLALELPPLSVPLYCQHAADERRPPTLGGEMSAAIQAADTDRVVGIDGPSVGFCRSLAGELYRRRASTATLRRTAGSLRSVTATTLRSRLASAVNSHTPVELAVDLPTAYDADRSDDPETQAADERDRMRTAESMLGAFGPPPAAAIRRTVRERHMADRLAALRAGAVVAVVGQAHLAAVASHLRND